MHMEIMYYNACGLVTKKAWTTGKSGIFFLSPLFTLAKEEASREHVTEIGYCLGLCAKRERERGITVMSPKIRIGKNVRK